LASSAGWPKMRTVPKSGFRNPRIDLISVDLPEPFGPITPTNVPWAIDTLTSNSAGVGP
jgi:hypothetical protein